MDPGWYDRHYDLAGEDPAGYSKLLVQQAIDRYDAEGREAALDYYSSAESVDGEWYVIIIHPDGTRLAHPFLPLGENILDGGPDVTGYHFRPDIVAVEDRDWVSYVFENPDTGPAGPEAHLGRAPRRPALRRWLVRARRLRGFGFLS